MWEAVAPTFPLTTRPLMVSRPLVLAFRHSQASMGLSSRNLMYRVTPAAENIPQYYATRVSTTVHEHGDHPVLLDLDDLPVHGRLHLPIPTHVGARVWLKEGV